MTLEQQISDLWGRIGNWNEGGIDRVQELAALLRDAGITTLDQIAVNPAQFEDVQGRRGFGIGEMDSQQTFTPDPEGPDTDRVLRNTGSWSMGGQNFGFLGDVNNDGSMGANRSGSFQFAEDNPMVGWSARGDGNTAYRLMRQPDGSMAIVPTWASSSDAEDLQNIGQLGLGMAAMVGAGGLLAGAGGAAGASAPISTAGLSGAGSGLQSSLAALNATAAATPTTAGMGGLLGTAGGLASGPAMSPVSGLGTPSIPTGGVAPVSGAEFGLGGLANPLPAIPSLANAAANGNSTGNTLRNLAPVAGAVLGAATSGDQTATSSRDPWGPAQPFIRDMIQQGQQLSQQYRDNPFSSTQRQAYGNLFGLLNQFNTQMAPGLLSNINSMRVGGSPVGAPSMGMLNPTFRAGG